MEGVSRPDTPPPPSTLRCVNELIHPNLDSSSLFVEDWGDIFRGAVDVTSHDCITWTDKKHMLYLNHLEESFINQLHNSRGFVARCSQRNKIAKNLSKKLSRNVSGQDSLWQRTNHVITDMQEYPKLQNTEKHLSRKKIASHGCFDALKEGTGQNFMNDDNHKEKDASPAKRLKLTLSDT